MKSKILILLVFAASVFKANYALAQPYPTVFIHGHKASWDMWDNLLKKLPAKQTIYITTSSGGGLMQFKNGECINTKSCAKDSIWLFDYYQNGGGCNSGGTDNDPFCVGKIGNPKDSNGNVVLRDSLSGEQDVWGNGKTYNDVRNYANNLSVAVGKILEATGASKVNVVAHSEGGLVARAYAKWYGGADKIHRILFIATPNYGLSDVAEHVAQYGLWCYGEINLIIFNKTICDEGTEWDPFWQRIGEDLEMYPKLVDGFTFGNETKPPETILGKNLPSYSEKTWLDWLNQDPLIPNSIEYATIAGSYKQQAIEIASNTVAKCDCTGGQPSFGGNCCDPFCFWKAGPCNCCGYPTIVTYWYLIKEMLQQRPIPDDTTINVNEVQLPGAAFNDIIAAAHQKMPAPFDKIDEEHLLTESSHIVMRITQWIYNNEYIYQSYIDPEVSTGSSEQGGGDSVPFYKFTPQKFVYLPPLINPETENQFLQGVPFDLKNLMPQKGPYDSMPKEKEPDFFLQFPGESNALEIYAVDYESTNNVVVAAILAEVTEGSPYTHDFATCARYAGYSLDDVKVVTIGDAYYYEAVLSKSQELVYEISFYLLINLDEVVIDSVWISDSIGVPQDQIVINVQIWTINPEETEKLVTAFLANVGSQIFGLNYANNLPKEMPNTFFKTAKVSESGGGIEVSIFNRCKLEEIKIDELLWPKAGDSQFNVSYSVVVSAGDQELYIPHPQMDSAVIYLQNESQPEFKDKIYVNKPLNPCNLNPQAWWSYNDAAVGGSSSVEITTQIPDAPQNLQKKNVFLEILSSVHLEGKVTTSYQYGFVGCGIALSSCQNSVDLSSAAGLSFMVHGDGKTYRVKLESAAIEDYDYYGLNFATSGDWTYFDIPFATLAQEGWGVAKPFSASDILNLSFQTVGQPYESVLLEVSDVIFYQKLVPQETEFQVVGLVPYLSLDNISQTFTLIGTEFNDGIEIYVGGNKLETVLISENYLQFNVSGMAPGSYDLEIVAVGQAPIVLEDAVVIIDSQNESLKTDLCKQIYIAPIEPSVLADIGAENSAEFAPEPDVVEIVDTNISDAVVAMPDVFVEDNISIDIADVQGQLTVDALAVNDTLAAFVDENVVHEDSKNLLDAIFNDSFVMIDLGMIDTQAEGTFVGLDLAYGIDAQHFSSADSIVRTVSKDTESTIEISFSASTSNNKNRDSGCSYSASNNLKPIYWLLVLIVFVAARKRRFTI